jgi:hypothetical protein
MCWLMLKDLTPLFGLARLHMILKKGWASEGDSCFSDRVSQVKDWRKKSVWSSFLAVHVWLDEPLAYNHSHWLLI